MGTGITALTLWVLRFVLYLGATGKDSNHLIVAHFFPTIPIGAIVIPTSGALLVSYWSSATVSQYMLLVCVISWGIGFFNFAHESLESTT